MVELRRTDVELGHVLAQAAEDHRAAMADRGVELELRLPEEPAFVHGDETRLAQVVGNLLHNAGKFTPRGGRVTLSLAREGGDAVFEVRDTGIGIEGGLLERLFQPFSQAIQTLARTQGGLGLGLALVKGLVDLHGGEVRASSVGRGRGATFSVRVPLAEPSPVPVAPEAAPARPKRRLHVLVVDDNRDAAESLAELVTLFGHDVDVAFDGPAALEKVRARRPDVVLCDIGLPGMDGYEVARALRAAHDGRLRLVAVSGYAQPEDVRQATLAGFDEHVAKPADPDRIEAVLA
jgi:CheY-like chemotaxis protein/two-component sensor histidine kinase